MFLKSVTRATAPITLSVTDAISNIFHTAQELTHARFNTTFEEVPKLYEIGALIHPIRLNSEVLNRLAVGK